MSEYTSWNDPDLPAAVRFAPEVLDRIRFLAIDGLLSLPRVGMGLGGMLLGARDEQGILVSEFREIACRHAFGPSFRLTAEEVAAAAAEWSGGESGGKVVGCWVSKTRGGAQLGPDDRMLFDSLCPGDGQVAFVIEPSSVRPTRGAIFARSKEGGLKGGALVDIAAPKVEAPPQTEEAAVVAAPIAAAAPAPKPELKLEPKVEAKPEPVAPRLFAVEAPEKTRAAARVPEAPAEPPLFAEAIERPLFASWAAPDDKKPARSLRWVVAAIVVAALSAVAFATSNYWIPGRSLDLRSSDSNGHLIIEWNRKAVRGIPRALLTVKDGPDNRTLTVEGSILHSGSLDYERKTGKVTVRMRAGSADETTTFNSNP